MTKPKEGTQIYFYNCRCNPNIRRTTRVVFSNYCGTLRGECKTCGRSVYLKKYRVIVSNPKPKDYGELSNLEYRRLSV